MSYVTLVTALKTRLETLTSTFSTGDITRGDYSCLDNGNANHLVLLPGSFSDIPEGVSRSILFDLFVKPDDDGGKTDFETVRDTVEAKIHEYPTLNHLGNYYLQAFSSTDDPQEVFDKLGAGPFFIVQRFQVTYVDGTPITTGEYA